MPRRIVFDNSDDEADADRVDDANLASQQSNEAAIAPDGEPMEVNSTSPSCDETGFEVDEFEDLNDVVPAPYQESDLDAGVVEEETPVSATPATGSKLKRRKRRQTYDPDVELNFDRMHGCASIASPQDRLRNDISTTSAANEPDSEVRAQPVADGPRETLQSQSAPQNTGASNSDYKEVHPTLDLKNLRAHIPAFEPAAEMGEEICARNAQTGWARHKEGENNEDKQLVFDAQGNMRPRIVASTVQTFVVDVSSINMKGANTTLEDIKSNPNGFGGTEGERALERDKHNGLLMLLGSVLNMSDGKQALGSNAEKMEDEAESSQDHSSEETSGKKQRKTQPADGARGYYVASDDTTQRQVYYMMEWLIEEPNSEGGLPVDIDTIGRMRALQLRIFVLTVDKKLKHQRGINGLMARNRARHEKHMQQTQSARPTLEDMNANVLLRASRKLLTHEHLLHAVTSYACYCFEPRNTASSNDTESSYDESSYASTSTIEPLTSLSSKKVSYSALMDSMVRNQNHPLSPENCLDLLKRDRNNLQSGSYTNVINVRVDDRVCEAQRTYSNYVLVGQEADLIDKNGMSKSQLMHSFAPSKSVVGFIHLCEPTIPINKISLPPQPDSDGRIPTCIVEAYVEVKRAKNKNDKLWRVNRSGALATQCCVAYIDGGNPDVDVARHLLGGGLMRARALNIDTCREESAQQHVDPQKTVHDRLMSIKRIISEYEELRQSRVASEVRWINSLVDIFTSKVGNLETGFEVPERMRAVVTDSIKKEMETKMKDAVSNVLKSNKCSEEDLNKRLASAYESVKASRKAEAWCEVVPLMRQENPTHFTSQCTYVDESDLCLQLLEGSELRLDDVKLQFLRASSIADLRDARGSVDKVIVEVSKALKDAGFWSFAMENLIEHHRKAWHLRCVVMQMSHAVSFKSVPKDEAVDYADEDLLYRYDSGEDLKLAIGKVQQIAKWHTQLLNDEKKRVDGVLMKEFYQCAISHVEEMLTVEEDKLSPGLVARVKSAQEELSKCDGMSPCVASGMATNDVNLTPFGNLTRLRTNVFTVFGLHEAITDALFVWYGCYEALMRVKWKPIVTIFGGAGVGKTTMLKILRTMALPGAIISGGSSSTFAGTVGNEAGHAPDSGFVRFKDEADTIKAERADMLKELISEQEVTRKRLDSKETNVGDKRGASVLVDAICTVRNEGCDVQLSNDPYNNVRASKKKYGVDHAKIEDPLLIQRQWYVHMRRQVCDGKTDQYSGEVPIDVVLARPRGRRWVTASRVIEALATFMIVISNCVPGVNPITPFVERTIAVVDAIYSRHFNKDLAKSRDLAKIKHIIIALAAEQAVYQTFISPLSAYAKHLRNEKKTVPWEMKHMIQAIPAFVCVTPEMVNFAFSMVFKHHILTDDTITHVMMGLSRELGVRDVEIVKVQKEGNAESTDRKLASLEKFKHFYNVYQPGEHVLQQECHKTRQTLAKFLRKQLEQQSKIVTSSSARNALYATTSLEDLSATLPRVQDVAGYLRPSCVHELSKKIGTSTLTHGLKTSSIDVTSEKALNIAVQNAVQSFNNERSRFLQGSDSLGSIVQAYLPYNNSFTHMNVGQGSARRNVLNTQWLRLNANSFVSAAELLEKSPYNAELQQTADVISNVLYIVSRYHRISFRELDDEAISTIDQNTPSKAAAAGATDTRTTAQTGHRDGPASKEMAKAAKKRNETQPKEPLAFGEPADFEALGEAVRCFVNAGEDGDQNLTCVSDYAAKEYPQVCVDTWEARVFHLQALLNAMQMPCNPTYGPRTTTQPIRFRRASDDCEGDPAARRAEPRDAQHDATTDERPAVGFLQVNTQYLRNIYVMMHLSSLTLYEFGMKVGFQTREMARSFGRTIIDPSKKSDLPMFYSMPNAAASALCLDKIVSKSGDDGCWKDVKFVHCFTDPQLGINEDECGDHLLTQTFASNGSTIQSSSEADSSTASAGDEANRQRKLAKQRFIAAHARAPTSTELEIEVSEQMACRASLKPNVNSKNTWINEMLDHLDSLGFWTPTCDAPGKDYCTAKMCDILRESPINASIKTYLEDLCSGRHLRKYVSRQIDACPPDSLLAFDAADVHQDQEQ